MIAYYDVLYNNRPASCIFEDNIWENIDGKWVLVPIFFSLDSWTFLYGYLISAKQPFGKKQYVILLSWWLKVYKRALIMGIAFGNERSGTTYVGKQCLHQFVKFFQWFH